LTPANMVRFRFSLRTGSRLPLMGLVRASRVVWGERGEPRAEWRNSFFALNGSLRSPDFFRPHWEPVRRLLSSLAWCYVLLILVMICDTTFLWVLRFSSLLKNQRYIMKFQFDPHGNNVIESNLMIVICCRKKIHASGTQHTGGVKYILINSRAYDYLAALPTQIEGCVRCRFPLRS